MKPTREYIIIALTVQNLVNDKYSFKEVNNTIEVIDDEGNIDYYTDVEFKKWVLDKALDY